MVMEAKSNRRSLRALDWLNVCMSDVQTGIGPYLAIYLMATRHWDPAHIGLWMSAMGLASVVAQTPAGALADRLRQKRWMIVAASVVVAIGCLWIVTWPALAWVIAAQALIGSTATIFPTAVTAITLGLVGPSQLAERMGRNGACNHAGTVGGAILAGLIGYYIAQEGIFYLVIAIFALAAVLFHFANAAMLPLVGELLSTGHDQGSSLYMSACIIVAQLIMIPVQPGRDGLRVRVGGNLSCCWASSSCRFGACCIRSAAIPIFWCRFRSSTALGPAFLECCRCSSWPISPAARAGSTSRMAPSAPPSASARRSAML